MPFISKYSLIESMALYPTACAVCGGDIDFADDCYIDVTPGIEEHQAKIYCVECVENERQI